MLPGDFVITPSWTWHDHGNESDGPMVWIDGLDMHIVNLLGASFRESYPDKIFPTNRPTGSTQAIAGSNMLPEGYRSEEHTSELQSLMRISYSVFCLKKTQQTKHNHTRQQITSRH